MTVDTARINNLNDRSRGDGDYVLYWMQQSQRARCNHALEHAVHLANTAGLPLLVCFVLTADYPEANLRHYTFMLEGLQETERVLAGRGIRLIVLQNDPVQGVLGLASRASSLVCDRGYLRHQRVWRRETARKAMCPVIQVESDVVVPVEVASDKREFAARTIRRKIQSRVDEFLDPPRELELERTSLGLNHPSLALDDIPALCRRLGVDSSVPPVTGSSMEERARPRNASRAFSTSGSTGTPKTATSPRPTTSRT
jgi:deoxyribodipyrimidine photo-lyase